MCFVLFSKRYFLRKLKKVKKSNGQMLAINEVHFMCFVLSVIYDFIVCLFWFNYFYENEVDCPRALEWMYVIDI